MLFTFVKFRYYIVYVEITAIISTFVIGPKNEVFGL